MKGPFPSNRSYLNPTVGSDVPNIGVGMDEVVCNGTETSLTQCTSLRGISLADG